MTTPTNSSIFGGTNVPPQYQNDIIVASQRWDISPAILAAQIEQESSFRPNAVSSAGAIGISQFMPETARSLGIDPFNTSQAIDAMARLDADYVKRFGSITEALEAYNVGPSGNLDSAANYASSILSRAGTTDTPVNATPVSSLDPFEKTTSLLSNLGKASFWKRIGIAALGVAAIGAGAYFMMEKEGFNVQRKLGNIA